MKQWCVVVGLAAWAAAGRLAWADEGAKDVAAAGALEQVAKRATDILDQEKIHDLFDWYRKMADYGVTFQPGLLAPCDLAGKLDPDRLRVYAGIKLMDALYAATFLQRMEVAKGVRAVEEVQGALDLRSHADVGSGHLRLLVEAADRPEALDVRVLIEQLAAEYANELPALLSSGETADYLMDSLYGMAIEMSYITGSLWGPENAEKLEEGFAQYPTSESLGMLLELFEAFGRMGDRIRVGEGSEEKLAVVRGMYDLEMAERTGRMSAEEAEAGWIDAAAKIAAIRAAILAP